MEKTLDASDHSIKWVINSGQRSADFLPRQMLKNRIIKSYESICLICLGGKKAVWLVIIYLLCRSLGWLIMTSPTFDICCFFNHSRNAFCTWSTVTSEALFALPHNQMTPKNRTTFGQACDAIKCLTCLRDCRPIFLYDLHMYLLTWPSP